MTRYQVWLDGLGLQDVHPAIRVLDVQEETPSRQFTTASRALGDGQFVTRRSRNSLSITVRFAIREYSPARRKAIMQDIRAWAQGRWLSLGDRPGQRLLVEAETLPAVQSALKWTDACSVSFIACASPYWEEAIPVPAGQASPVITPPGDAPCCPLDLRWKCGSTSGKITLSVTTPLSSIVFSDLPINTGQELIISHENGFLSATVNGADVLACRTPQSSDDLLLNCRKANAVTVSVTGASTGDYTLSARGRWL